jgi:hypothetical protein
MKKVLFLGALALGASACDPDIAKDAAPTNPVVVAEFDPSASPPVVPSPNDLAIVNGLVNAPVNPAAPAAEQEFTRDYVNTLNGFPASITVSTTVKNLDPTTVDETTVKILDLYAGTPLSRPVPADILIGYNPDTDRINILAPSGWPKGGRYAVALVGGPNGLKTMEGNPVIPSATWAFASSQEPLVTCEDLTAPNCRAATELIPATETDPTRRIAQQTATALQLEQLRRGYGPLIDQVSEKFSVNRDDIVLLWTFTVVNQPEATFDLASRTIPFPNDLVRIPKTDAAPARLNLPEPPDAPGNETQLALIRGLNTLDGWSTTAPIISENGVNTGAIDLGSQLDPTTLKLGETVRFINLKTGAELDADDITVCLNCVSSKPSVYTGRFVPEQLQFVPKVPLDEQTPYAVVLTRGIKDIKGRLVAPSASQALARSSAPLMDDKGQSTVAAVPSTLVKDLEDVRKGMKGMYDALEAVKGIKRKDVVLAWAFTTQSTRPVLEQLNAVPAQASIPADPLYMWDETTRVKNSLADQRLESAAIGRAFLGGYVSPYLLTDTTGTLGRANARIDTLPFMLFVPATAAPEGGYPVVVFGHGLTGNRNDVLKVANTLNANGFAVAAIDTVLHGERTSCAGISPTNPAGPFTSANAACNPGSTCDETPNSVTFGRCIATATAATCDPRPAPATNSTDPAERVGDAACAELNQGRCLTTGKCEGGDFRRAPSASDRLRSPPLISGWNFLNTANLFATRDNFRHHVVDMAQFSRVLGSDVLRGRLAAYGVGALNTSQVDYLGQSLGSLQGTLSASVNPRMRRVALNAAGSSLVDVLLTSPAFQAQSTAFKKQLSDLGRPEGSPAFDEFVTLARTILDPADARNFAQYLTHAPSQPAGRAAFVQYIENDEVIPNATTALLLSSANRTQPDPNAVQWYMWSLPQLTTFGAKHNFLTVNDPTADAGTAAFLKSIRDAAQGQVAGFLKTGTAQLP